MKLLRTDTSNKDFVELVRQLDDELRIRNGEEESFYAPFNKLNLIKYALVAFDGEEAVGCGALKPFSDDAMEVKRMFVPLHRRGKGIARQVLMELEKWAAEMHASRCVLETGLNNYEATALYKKNGYRLIPNYGQYAGMKTSICFEKNLR
jgi:putative acetyltransferase